MLSLLQSRPAWALVVFFGCAPAFDTSRDTPERGTLGEELFGVVCDRVGAQSLREDVRGASYDALCHRRSEGGFAAEVDRAALPALSPTGSRAGNPLAVAQAREHNIARLEVLAEERDALAEAFDAMIPDSVIGNSLTPVRLYEALPRVLSGLTPMYEDETVPHVTRALGELLHEVERDASIATALTRLDARDGYHPETLALYVLRPTLTYPRLFDLGSALSRVHREDAHGARQKLRGLFGTTARAIASALATPLEPEAKLLVSTDALSGRAMLTRARSGRELALSLLSDQVFGESAPVFSIVRRDARGVADVLMQGGALPYPFLADAQGAPKLNALGRFITADHSAPPLPFSTGIDPLVPRDILGRALGRDGKPLYATVDVRGTLLRELSSAFAPLVRPRVDAGEEAVFDTLALAPALLGDRLRRDGGFSFDADTAPFVDLVHALGATVEKPELEVVFSLFAQLAREKPALVARLSRLVLKLDAIADRYPVSLRVDSTFWDELIDVLIAVAQTEGLLEDVLRALEDPDTTALGPVFASYMRYRDELTYARDAKHRREVLNGKVYNRTTSDFSDMHTKVDRGAPDTGLNRSVLQRFLALLHDAKGLPACSKDNAIAHIDIRWPPGTQGVPIRLDYPIDALARTVCGFVGSRAPRRIAECGILRFDNVAEMIIDVALGDVQIEVRDDCLKKLMVSPIAAVVGGADAFLEDISGISGFSLHPTVKGVARLAFFEASYDAFGDFAGEGYYPKTNTFLKDVLDPVPSMVCGAESYRDLIDGKEMSLRRCDKFEDTLRGRHKDGLFPLEQLGFLDKVQPLARAFGKHKATPLFVSLLDVLHLHWGSARQSKSECDPTLKRGDARYCTQDGLVAYEPMLADMLDEAELLSELSVLARTLAQSRVKHCDSFSGDGRCREVSERDGISVVAEAVRALIDPKRNVGLTDRRGEPRARRNDGTFSAQATPLSLWLDALSRLDARERSDEQARATWLRARSAWIDALLRVEGSTESPFFALRGLERALPLALDLLREQVTAHCPQRTTTCPWIQHELTRSARALVAHPVTADLFAVLEALSLDDVARVELGRFVAHLTSDLPDQVTQASILAALIDLLQVSGDREGLRPVLGLVEHALAGDAGVSAENALVPAFLELLSRFFAGEGSSGAIRAIDPYRALQTVLRNTVMPMAQGRPAPLEVLATVISRVNRRNPRARGAFAPEDFQQLTRELSALLLDKQSGLEQVYAILQQAGAR